PLWVTRQRRVTGEPSQAGERGGAVGDKPIRRHDSPNASTRKPSYGRDHGRALLRHDPTRLPAQRADFTYWKAQVGLLSQPHRSGLCSAAGEEQQFVACATAWTKAGTKWFARSLSLSFASRPCLRTDIGDHAVSE